MNPALIQLFLLQIKGRIRFELKRLTNPKYLIPTVLIVTYLSFWLIGISFGVTPGFIEEGMNQDIVKRIIAGFILIWLTSDWWFPFFNRSLDYYDYERETLFFRPLKNKDLIGYNLLKRQPKIFFGSLIWALLLGRFLGGNQLILFPTLILLRNFHVLHGLVVSLLTAASDGKIWFYPLRMFLGLLIMLIAVLGILRDTQHFEIQLFPYATMLNSVALPTIVLDGVGLFLKPLFSSGIGASLRSAAGILACNGVLFFAAVRLVDYLGLKDFERTAKNLQKFKGLKGSFKNKKRSKRFNIPLDPIGPLWRTFLWKNTLGWLRSGGFWYMAVSIPAVIIFTVIVTLDSDPIMWVFLGFFVLLLGGITMLIAPQGFRYDFRNDLNYLNILKSQPLSAKQLFLGEIALPSALFTAVMFIIHLYLCLGLYIGADRPLEPGLVILSWALIPAIPLIPITMFTMENGLVLKFPGWLIVKKDARGKARERMQNSATRFIGGLIRLGGLGVFLFLPGTSALVLLLVFFQSDSLILKILAPLWTGTLIAYIQLYFAVHLFSGWYEQIHPDQEGLNQ